MTAKKMDKELDKGAGEGEGDTADRTQNPVSDKQPGGTDTSKEEAKAARLARKADDTDDDEADTPSVGDKLRKVNRGSTRRLIRAQTNFEEAAKAFIEEVDRQVYEQDEDGNRIGDCELVVQMRRVVDGVREKMNEYTAAGK